MDAALIGLAGGGGAVLVAANVWCDRLRARPDPPPLEPVPWDQLDEQTAEWVRANLQLAGVAAPTESPDVEDLGLVSNWDKPHNPALVRKITESGSCTERELESLSIADYAYVRPYLLRAHGLSSYVDHPAIGDEHA